MFKFLFYFLGLLGVLYEYWAIANYDKIAALRAKIKLGTKEKVTVKLSKNETVFTLLQLCYFFWALVGLFSSQWQAFGIIFILSMGNQFLKGRVWNFIDSVLTIALILFAILNTYHWHINLIKTVYQFYVGQN